MNPVVHFEMPFDDKARLTRFYEQAFGWQMQGMGAEMGDYVLATTTPSDAGGRPTGIGKWFGLHRDLTQGEVTPGDTARSAPG